MTQHDFAKKFCSDNDLRPHFQHPIVINRNNVKHVAATNTYCLVTFPDKDGTVSKYEESLEKQIIQVLDSKPLFDTPKTIQVSELQKAIDSLPLIPEMDGEEIECPECEGEGEIECEECGHTYTCKTCKGEGIIDKSKPTGRMICDVNAYVKIGNSIYRGCRVQEMMTAIDYANVDIISHIKGDDALSSAVFMIGQIEMLVMPCVVDEHDTICYTVKYND